MTEQSGIPIQTTGATEGRASSPTRWLLVALAASVIVNAALVLLLMSSGNSPLAAIVKTTPAEARFLLSATQKDDSWMAMALADEHRRADSAGDIYEVFFTDRIKFQYPPSALLFWRLFPEALYSGASSVEDGTALRRWLSALSVAAVLLTILLSVLILRSGLMQMLESRGEALRLRSKAAVAVCLLGLTYYPLLKSHSLGQIQVFLGLMIALALFLQMRGRSVLAGVCIGLCCLVKPQYALVCLWSLFARDWKFLAGVAATGAAGLAVSLAEFGWSNHLNYIEVLRYISWHGEVYWPNQSINGFLNRLLSNGDPNSFSPESFAAHNSVVSYATAASSAAFVAVALWATATTPRQNSRARTLGLAIMLMASTLASPVAWEHHYGAFLPIFAVALPWLWFGRPWGKWTGGLLLLSYLFMSIGLLHRYSFFDHPLPGMARSHLLVGALVLFALCVAALRRGLPSSVGYVPDQVVSK